MREDEFDIEAIRKQLRQDQTYTKPAKPHVIQGGGNKGNTTYRPVGGNPAPDSRPYKPVWKQDGNTRERANGRINASPNALVSLALKIYEWIDQLFKSIGIVTGGIATSLADWILGAITMNILLSGYSGFDTPMKWATGAVFSLSLWGIQIILWRVILTGKIKKIEKINNLTTFWMTVGVFVLIGLMKFGDDFTDILGIYWLIRENPIQYVLSAGLYKIMLGVVFFMVWIVCGFAEVFVSLSINLLKDDNRGN